ncbi:hypothetical protein DLM45_03280 [Hyphomicrobium methylovorum]|uniref:hypothetical protein n=1 Tax=Hyphomicrobium methylovorum TaxID=84 RepID=UPI0015E6D22B|nr:hypothetical protein [Hyphomicrobium methylovorum]MBA2125246.1 hypothetical protein [Hyphomicrobium methylovorum]
MRHSSVLHPAIAAVALLLALGAGALFHVPSALAAKAKGGTGRQAPLDESKMTCKQLSGRIQLLILQLRGHETRQQSSSLSRGMQSAASTIGATATGSDPSGQQASDLNRLQSYNQRLASMGCKSYNLEQELKQTDPMQSPSATVPPPKKAKSSKP